MIDIKVGDSYKLENGSVFVCTAVLNTYAEGRIDVGFNSFKGLMFLNSGQVFDSMMMIYYSSYNPQIKMDIKPVVECRCGGLTTYKSMDGIYHSRWCDVNQQGAS